MRRICQFILKFTNWKITSIIDHPKKCILCVAPHTSNIDLLLGLIVYKSMGRKASFLIKKDWFFFPMNIVFNLLGGIPVDRSRKTSLTEQIAAIFNQKESFELAITPEGTREKNPEWKRGFYYIAIAAKVPIVVAALDYGKKEVNFKKVIVPSGDADADIDLIKSYYEGVTARHPEKFAL